MDRLPGNGMKYLEQNLIFSLCLTARDRSFDIWEKAPKKGLPVLFAIQVTFQNTIICSRNQKWEYSGLWLALFSAKNYCQSPNSHFPQLLYGGTCFMRSHDKTMDRRVKNRIFD